MKKFISRKMLFAALSMIILCLTLIIPLHNHLLGEIHAWIVISTALICETVVCVTYLTGQAKIDLNANLQGSAKIG